MSIAINNIGNNRLIDESQPQKPYLFKSTLVETIKFPGTNKPYYLIPL